jgi:1-acyl-sn-glycerol-3-phosphate acyltransferase
MYTIAQFIVRAFVHFFAVVTVEGYENIPAGPFVAAANHVGRLDATLIFVVLKDRQDVLTIVAEKYRKNPFFRFMVRYLNLAFVDRFHADLKAVRLCLNHLKNGGVLVLAPEGTRSPDAKLQEGKLGTGYIAVRANAPILPVALIGSEDSIFFPNLKRLRRTAVTLRIGKPFHLAAPEGRLRDETLQAYTDEIMCRIAALLPDQQRGFYTDHPRLRELSEAGTT